MQRIKIAPTYNAEWLETDRPQPLSDARIEELIEELLPHQWGYDTTNDLYTQFKSEMQAWLFGSKLNNVTGFDKFTRIDIINGCTQFIDNIYMQGPVQVIKGDYRYHARLDPNLVYSVPGYLRKGLPLIIAMPFPSTGNTHNQMPEILDECLSKEIPVHIDGAWITCSRDIVFDVGHPAIRSCGISLSKGLGLGWNRVGLRWTCDTKTDAVTIMNDFNMNMRATVMIGLHFIRQLPIDYLWSKYSDTYYKICQDFNLIPTNSIYLALQEGHPVGVSPLIRYLNNAPK